MWTYGGTYPGLTIRRPTGQSTRVTFTNNLPTLAGGKTVHHHGAHAAAIDDGYTTGPAYLFEPGTSRTYTYDLTENGENERGTMQWYHDHRMGETGMNVWFGLTGLFIIDDPADPQTLPSGVYDLPLVIADRQFDSQNQLQYFYDPAGVIGDTVLVNGVYQPYFEVADRKYRFRILNGANASTYILTLSNGDNFTQIGTESGLLPAPVTRSAMDFGPAERLDVVVDFSGKLGQEFYLMDAYQVRPLLKFKVTQHVIDTSSIPASLRALPDIGTPTVTRNFSFDYISNHWTINGQSFDPNRTDAKPVLGTTEKWVFTNPTGTTHFVHIHDVDQQCVSRDGGACYPYETMKETWALWSGETLELKLKFTDHAGIYMMHCHILEHEDDGMMTQFEVVLNALQQWREDAFGTTSASDPTGGDLADPDHDGIPNLAEYSSGSDPKVANVSRLPQIGQTTVNGSSYLTISYRMLTAANAGITYVVEESSNLTSWTPIDMATNLVSGPTDQGDGTAIVTFRGNTAIGSGKDYLHLRISTQ